MVNAINFAVRSSVGGRQHGTVAGEGQSNFIQVGVGDSISLNITPSSIVAYEQQGRDLVIKLVDGRVIVLSGYFDAAAGTNHLYLSANDQITEVMLSGNGSGVLMANYGPAQPMEKWSPLDDLRFSEADGVIDGSAITDEPAGMGLFAPAMLGGLGGLGLAGAGLVGLGLVGGGGGGTDTTPGGGGTDTTPGGGGTDTTPGGGGTDTTPGGGGNDRIPPTVNDPNSRDVLTTNTNNPIIEVTGTGQSGDTVVVTVGDRTQTTIIAPDNTWGVRFESDNLPADGSYSTVVVVTEPGGTQHVLDGPDYVIDMTPPAVEFSAGTDSVGHIENLADYADGITISGEGEVGATIRIEVGGLTRETVVNGQGNWTFTFTQDEIAGGERTLDVTVTATDPLGNVTVITDQLVIDTIPHPVSINPVTENNLVNEAEFTNGFTMTGNTNPNTTVTLVVEGGGRTITHTIIADATGAWVQTFPEGTIPSGTYQATATLTTVDGAGNPSSVTRTFDVDTEVDVAFGSSAIAGDNMVNAVEAAGVITMTGTSAPGSSISVEWAGSTRPATTDASGNWTVSFPGGTAAGGTYDSTAIVTATDSAGNRSTDRRDIRVDTEIAAAIDERQTGDNWVSGAERSAGFDLTGTGEPGATLTVTVTTPGGAVTHPATVGADGTWKISYGPGELPSGTYQATVAVSARDAAGNVATDSHTMQVDTETGVTIGAQQAGDNIISGAERLAGITLTGTAEAGAMVSVTFNGVTYPDVRANGAGVWALPVGTSGIPAGTTSATVSVTATDRVGNVASANHVVNIDTEVVPLTRGTMSTGSDSILNDAEASRGLTVTGTVESGSTVMVSFDGHEARAATVSGGVWSITIPPSQIPNGTTSGELIVTATDRVGNVGVHRETVAIDREVTPLRPGQTVLAGDGYLNAQEAAAGLTVTGVSEPNSTVTVQIMVGDQVFGSPVRIVTDATGNWSTTFVGPNLPNGELNAQVVVTARDLAGNTGSYSQPIIIDTVAPGAPNVVRFERVSAGLTRIVTQDADDSYEFTQIDANGNASRINVVRSVDEVTGDENITFGSRGATGFTPTPVPDGSYLVVDSTDVAGNQSSTLMIINNTNAPEIDLSRPGLTSFDFSAIDLTFAPDADLTITEAQILSITGANRTIMIRGGEDDRVEIVGGVNSGRTQEVDGETYAIYTVGTSGATILLDEDIQTV